MSDMLLEVDEALRAQQIKALWDKYGQLVIGLAIAAVFVALGGVFWQNHMTQKFQKSTTELLTILQSDSDRAEAVKKLEALKGNTAAPLNGIVALYQAQSQEKAGDLKGARATYEKLATESSTASSVRELAVVQDVRLGIILKDAPAALLRKIDNSATKGSAFENTALELKGILLLQLGKKEEARKIFEGLSNDMQASNTVRVRAKALMSEGAKADAK